MVLDRSSLGNELSDYVVIVARHCLSFVVIIFTSLIIALYLLGQTQDAFFIASVIVINVVVGIIQEVRAKRALDKLRRQTRPMALLVGVDQQTRLVPVEELAVGQVVRLKIGDQVPGDGRVVKVEAFEVNEAFLTGESLPVGKRMREQVFAGSFAVAGRADIRLEALGEDTRMGRITDDVARFNVRTTPLQRAVGMIIAILGWGLIVIALAIGIRNHLSGEQLAGSITQVAAIAATIVPEGLLLATTLLFAYGAVRLFRRQVLLQQINATESLGRVRTLCLDKTGTLTEDRLELIGYEPAPKQRSNQLERVFGQYLRLTDPESEMAQAYSHYHSDLPAATGEVTAGFSSERKYGVVKIAGKFLVCGAPDVLAKYARKNDLAWLEEQNNHSASRGERVLLLAYSMSARPNRLKILGLARLAQPIKASAPSALKFFARRGVRLVIISGDQAESVRAIAKRLGLADEQSQVVTGAAWQEASTRQRHRLVDRVNLFARVTPQQKAEIVQLLGHHGFVAMTGDGANDALALKKADLGISMFAAAEITRTVADVVLIKNDFADLPHGVELADQIITTLELVAIIFFTKIVTGLTLVGWTFASISAYPLSPRMITLLNYFLIGLPIILWTVWPRCRPRRPQEPNFWIQIAPFTVANSLALITTIGLASHLANTWDAAVGMVIFLVVLVMGVATFFLAPYTLGARADEHSRARAWVMSAAIAVLIISYLATPVRRFFGLGDFALDWLVLGLLCAVCGVILQIVFISVAALIRRIVRRDLQVL